MNRSRAAGLVACSALLALSAACSSGRPGGAGSSAATGSSVTTGSSVATGSSSATGSSAAPSCVATGGSRCAGPAPITVALQLGAGGRRLHGVFLCGGRLTASESRTEVRLRYTASAVRRGGLACARVDLSVTLAAPLGSRAVVDALTGTPVRVVR